MTLGWILALFASVLFLCTDSEALECLDCTDALVNSTSINDFVRTLISTFESTYRKPLCESSTTPRASAGITLNTCTDRPGAGQVNRCGRLVGEAKIVIDPPVIGRVEIPVHVHIRGCFIVEQNLKGGCYRDENIIKAQTGLFSHFLSALSTARVGGFNGVLCVNTPNNVETWGENMSVKNSPSLTMFILVLLIKMF